MDEVARRLIDHAALSGPFEPSRFRYRTRAERRQRLAEAPAHLSAKERKLWAAHVSDDEWSAALARLAPQCEEVTVEGRSRRDTREADRKQTPLRWSMRNADRSRALQGLAARPGDCRALWRMRGPLKDDVFGTVLRDCLGTAPLTVSGLEGRELRAAISAAIFAGALVDGARKAEVKGFERALYQRAVDVARQVRLHTVLPHPLSGRSRERQAVLAFLATGAIEAPAQATRHEVPAFLRRTEQARGPQGGAAPADDQTAVQRLLLTGSPGMGKSAFLADLVQIVGGGSSGNVGRFGAPIWIVAFDFDQLTLTRGGVIAWAEELTRQIGAQDDLLGRDLSRVRGEHAARRTDAPSTDPEASAAALLADAWTLLRQKPARRLILIADTIEEVTARDPLGQFTVAPQDTLFQQLITWAGQLGARDLGAVHGGGAQEGRAGVFTDVRLIASGRTGPPVSIEVLSDWFDATLELPVLDDAAGERLLQDRDPSLSPQLRARIVGAVGGHPLLLLLVQKHLASLPAADRAVIVAEIEAEGLRGGTSEHVIRTLYARFLDRLRVRSLPDGLTIDDLKRLAYPGLLLREVTAPLLAEVIGPAVGVVLDDEDVATQALSALREQVWLIAEGTNGAVRHRPDVRRVMLPMMLGAQTAEAVAVLERAIAWFEADGLPASRDEAGYLRALRGDVVQDIPILAGDASLAASVLAITGEDFVQLPLRSQAILKFHAPQRPPLDVAEIAVLPEALREEAFNRQESEALRKFGGTTPPRMAPAQSNRPDMNPFGLAPAAPRLDGLAPGGVSSAVGMARAAPPEGSPPPLTDAPAASAAPPELGWIASSSDAYDLLNDTRLAEAIEVAFFQADLEKVSRLGWTAIERISRWPDLSRPLRQRAPFHESWLWRTALASLVSPPDEPPLYYFPPEILAADLSVAVAGITRRATLDAAAFDLDAMLGLVQGASAQSIITERHRLEFAPRQLVFWGFRDLRLVTSSPFLRQVALAPGQGLVFPMMTGGTPLLARGCAQGADKQFRVDHYAQGSADAARGGLDDVFHAFLRTISAARRVELLDDIVARLDDLGLEPALHYAREFTIDGASSAAALPLYLRGQTPELHRTVVTSLMHLSPEDVADAARSMALQADFWPDSLAEGLPAALRKGGRSKAPVVQRLVRFADLCGLLPEFVRDLADRTRSADLVLLSQLFAALDRRWTLPQLRPEDDPG